MKKRTSCTCKIARCNCPRWSSPSNELQSARWGHVHEGHHTSPKEGQTRRLRLQPCRSSTVESMYGCLSVIFLIKRSTWDGSRSPLARCDWLQAGSSPGIGRSRFPDGG